MRMVRAHLESLGAYPRVMGDVVAYGMNALSGFASRASKREMKRCTRKWPYSRTYKMLNRVTGGALRFISICAASVRE